MRILFCRIIWMEYYKGIFPGFDEPRGNYKHVKETGDAAEKYCFRPIDVERFEDGTESGRYCLGFVETMSTSKASSRPNQLHIEKIDGCEGCKKDSSVDDVLVVYCSSHPDYSTTHVVGWFKHATVYRNVQMMDFSDTGDESELQYYNAVAKAEDCVLLPYRERMSTSWRFGSRKSGASIGFGRHCVWYGETAADQGVLEKFLKDITAKIEAYDGKNCRDEYPDLSKTTKKIKIVSHNFKSIY